MKIKGLIFDLDGVLVYTDKFHYQAWKTMADELGVYFDEPINHRLRGVSRMDSLEIILERYEGPDLSLREKEKLAEKKNDPVKTYADYDVNPVGQAEITDAQSEYEKLYEEEHARFVASHKEDISVASVEGIDSKLEEIYRIHDEKVAQEKRDTGNIEAISAETTAAKVAELPYAKKPEDYAEYKDIKGISVDEALVEGLGSVDHSEDDDAIGSVSEEFLAQKVKEFNEKYGR